MKIYNKCRILIFDYLNNRKICTITHFLPILAGIAPSLLEIC